MFSNFKDFELNLSDDIVNLFLDCCNKYEYHGDMLFNLAIIMYLKYYRYVNDGYSVRVLKVDSNEEDHIEVYPHIVS